MSTAYYKGRKYGEGKFFPVNDLLVVEELLKVTINNTPFTITMRMPGSENELVRGLLFSENIYTDTETEPLMEVKEKNEKGFIASIAVSIPKEKIEKGYDTIRSIVSVSSCGICGKSELDLLTDKSEKIISNESL